MKKQYLYLIVILAVLVAATLGWYYFSSQAAWFLPPPGVPCNKWKCFDTKTYSCSSGTTNYTCSNGILTCYICTKSNTTKYYNVTQTAVAYQNLSGNVTLAGIFIVNGETFGLSAGQKHALSDETMFGVTTLYLNYSAFYLQSSYETKSSSLTAPFPKSTIVNLIISQSQGCGAVTNSCPSGYTPSCAVNMTLICTNTVPWWYCGGEQPMQNCAKWGACMPCPI